MSIARSGVMQPVIVRPLKGGRYELVAGERRWRAATLALISRVPALVRELSDEQAAEWALIENVQREDLNAIEAAFGYRALADRFGLTHGQIAERVGLDRVSIANAIRLTELEPDIRALIESGRLTAGHGKALLAMKPGPDRIQAARTAAAQGWSVRRLESEAARSAPAAPVATDKNRAKDAARADLEKRLGEHLGTKVRLETNSGGTKGRMVVEFYGLDQFDGLLERIGFRGE